MRPRFLPLSLLLLFTASAFAAQPGSGTAPVPVSQTPAVVRDTLSGMWQNILGFLPFILAAMIVVVLTATVSGLGTLIARKTFARSRIRHPLQALFTRFIRFGIWFAGLLVAAVIIFPNLTPTNVLGGLGIASLAFGFIFKEFFENFFAGILILWRFPIDVGDFIVCKEIEGMVEEISVRMTLIRQVSDELVLVPNRFLTENAVKILTNLPKRRVLEVINVGYGGSVGKAVEVIRKAATGCETVDKGHRIEVMTRCLCPNGVDIELAWWTDPTPYDVRRSRGEVLAAVKEALEAAAIEVPSPYRAVVFKNRLDVAATVATPARKVETGGTNTADGTGEDLAGRPLGQEETPPGRT